MTLSAGLNSYNQPSFLTPESPLLRDLCGLMMVNGNTGTLSNIILDILSTYTGCSKSSVMLFNNRKELFMSAVRGMSIELIDEFRPEPGKAVSDMVVREQKPILVEDIEKDGRFSRPSRSRYRTSSFISCPISHNNKTLGVLNASDPKEAGCFTPEHLELCRVIADHAAIALENRLLVLSLQERVAELEEINRKFMSADTHRAEFLSHIAHDLRTPLNSIKGSVYLLENSEKLSRAEQKEFFSIISNETEKLERIVETHLELLTFDPETRSTAISVVNLGEVLHSLSSSKHISSLLASKGLNLKIDAGGRVFEIIGDKIRIHQMFYNLIEGMSFFLGSGSSLSVSVTEHDAIQVRVSSDECLAEDVLSIFSKIGYQIAEGAEDEKIKLYLARKLAEKLGWRLLAKNDEDGFVALLTINKCISRSMNSAVSKIFDLFLQFIAELLQVEICSLMLNDKLTNELKMQSAHGLSDEIVRKARVQPGDRISGWVAMSGQPLLIEDIESDPRFGKRNTPRYNSKSLVSVPLNVHGKVIGVFNINNKKDAKPLTPDDLQLATLLADRIAHLLKRLEPDGGGDPYLGEFTQLFEGLLSAGRRYHKKKTIFSDLVTKIMERIGSSEEDKVLAVYISRIYDLGLMSVDDSIFRNGRLEEWERASLKVHPFATVDMMSGFEFSPKVRQAILHHHEKYDGTGYPDGLAGENIPLISRVIAVVDAFCAMVSDRPYRTQMTVGDAVNEILGCSGAFYDPKVVRALVEAVEAFMR